MHIIFIYLKKKKTIKLLGFQHNPFYTYYLLLYMKFIGKSKKEEKIKREEILDIVTAN